MKHVTVQDARKLQASGATYVDVRSVPEFAHGHPDGALNVPLLHLDARTHQRQMNGDFVAVMLATFPPDAQLLIGCQAGHRSVHASQLLEQAGFTDVSNVLGGFGGSPMGDEGWVQAGLPVETDAPADRTYDTIHRKASGSR